MLTCATALFTCGEAALAAELDEVRTRLADEGQSWRDIKRGVAVLEAQARAAVYAWERRHAGGAA